MNFPEDYEYQCGGLVMVRARRVARQLEGVCGSPIEILFGCSVVIALDSMGFDIRIAASDEEMNEAAQYFMYPQKRIGKYRVDFLIGRAGLKPVIVECDGREFHHATREQIERDRLRDADLNQQGYRVLRYPGTQIHNDLWRVVFEVTSVVDDASIQAWMRANAEFL